MGSMNKVFMMGYLASAPELKMTANGKHMTVFRLAVNRKYNRQECDFFSVAAFGKTAEFIMQYFGLGKGIVICGYLRTQTYEARDGSRRYATEIIAEEVEFDGTKESKPASEAEKNAFRAEVSGTQMTNAVAGAGITAGTFEEIQDDGPLPF